MRTHESSNSEHTQKKDSRATARNRCVDRCRSVARLCAVGPAALGGDPALILQRAKLASVVSHGVRAARRQLGVQAPAEPRCFPGWRTRWLALGWPAPITLPPGEMRPCGQQSARMHNCSEPHRLLSRSLEAMGALHDFAAGQGRLIGAAAQRSISTVRHDQRHHSHVLGIELHFLGSMSRPEVPVDMLAQFDSASARTSGALHFSTRCAKVLGVFGRSKPQNSHHSRDTWAGASSTPRRPTRSSCWSRHATRRMGLITRRSWTWHTARIT